MPRRSETDESLLLATRAGDMAAFDELYDRYAGRLLGYIQRMVAESDRAEDIFQDVFFKVLRDRTYDPGRGRFSAWLFTVARNQILGVARTQKRRERLAPEPPPLEAPDMESRLSDAARVRAAMAGLTETQRQLLLLKQLGDLTYREIATALGVAEGTIKSRLHTATKAFRARLVEQGEGT